jgi:dimethylaniline monooxygenase (N-oxide forming)
VVKEEMTLPGLDYPEKTGKYPCKAAVLEYLQEYARKFDLMKHIRLSTRVTKVAKTKNGKWEVEWKEQISGTVTVEVYDGVIVASGQTCEPLNPCNEYEGFEEHFTGQSIHSTDYRNPTPYLDKKVLVVGVGSG